MCVRGTGRVAARGTPADPIDTSRLLLITLRTRKESSLAPQTFSLLTSVTCSTRRHMFHRATNWTPNVMPGCAQAGRAAVHIREVARGGPAYERGNYDAFHPLCRNHADARRCRAGGLRGSCLRRGPGHCRDAVGRDARIQRYLHDHLRNIRRQGDAGRHTLLLAGPISMVRILSHPGEFVAKVRLPADITPGLYSPSITCNNGMSGVAQFTVNPVPITPTPRRPARR